MFNKKVFLVIAFAFFIIQCNAQSCKLSIIGSVFDQETAQPLSYVNVFIQELHKGATTDDEGYFSIDNICEGEYHLVFSHIGCEDKKIHLDFLRDTTLNIILSHNPTSLGTIIVEGKKDELSNQPSSSVNRRTVEDNANQNISGLLENEAGVHLLKNGGGISKPVVHGLFGNRLTILNNGIAQSGQQWGNDHSPEIDPFVADRIVVLKGASAIEYGGGNLGSVILVEPKNIDKEPHLHGQVNYVFETNGKGHTFNTRFEKYSPILAWRINGTWKRYGDRKTAEYFLNNTGTTEANFSVHLEKSWNSKVFGEFYASTFNTTLGVLRGSHIGNLTDLEQALLNDVPFFTESNFSYQIDAPKQNVSHHLMKVKTKYFINDNQFFQAILAGQINNRKEFDLRRGERTDIPALSLKQFTFNSDLKYVNNFGKKWKFNLGNQNILTDNTNSPETGILPLIPDYISWKTGLYSTLSKNLNKFDFYLGTRYDYEYQNALTISRTIPREIIKYKNQFHNLSGLLTIKLNLSKTQSIGWNTGYATRNPAINELYSNGLHQGVSGIEEGDIELKTEKAYKNTLEYKWSPNTDFSFSTLFYYQHFKEYIYLEPQNEVRLTIRGAFPVFKYEQTDANIYGLDLSTQFTVGHSFLGLLKYSYIRGEDIISNQSLIFMPSNNLFGSFTYQVDNSLKMGEKMTLEEIELEINNKLVFQQNNISPEQDFVQPPPTYSLLGLKISGNLVFSNTKIRCFVKAENLLNTPYRDYLNRQRYFADDLGRSVVTGVNLKF